eukprot:363194-Chlamydomonas_euryale.AAC.3
MPRPPLAMWTNDGRIHDRNISPAPLPPALLPPSATALSPRMPRCNALSAAIRHALASVERIAGVRALCTGVFYTGAVDTRAVRGPSVKWLMLPSRQSAAPGSAACMPACVHGRGHAHVHAPHAAHGSSSYRRRRGHLVSGQPLASPGCTIRALTMRPRRTCGCQAVRRLAGSLLGAFIHARLQELRTSPECGACHTPGLIDSSPLQTSCMPGCTGLAQSVPNKNGTTLQVAS